ncbi:MAG: phage terminase large subunit family protein [Nitrospirae bacterium]|nr:phage terminase large subunit family protein [Nitrospirota bacterium]
MFSESQTRTKEAIRKSAKVAAPPPRLNVSEWADQFRRLSPESSSEPGQWQTDRVPYLRGIMDTVNDPQIEAIVIMSSCQAGKTEALLNVIGYNINQDPSPILVIMPTLELAESFSRDRLATMIRDTKVLRSLVKDPRSRDGENTLLHKKFPGGHITLAGANSPASLSSRPIRIVLCDEVDRYPLSAGTEGDPVSLARKRSATFWNRKIILTSTPTIKGVSRIEAAFEESDQRRYHVPCPDCGAFQVLIWGQVQWPEDRPDLASYVCEACSRKITDADKIRMLREGEWRPTAPTRKTAGFHLNEIYSPWIRFVDMVEAFREAKKLPETLKTWVNTSLGQSWEEEGASLEEESLSGRKEPYDLDPIPGNIVLITAGVDIQDDRIEVETIGWGRDYESWGLEYQIFYGDPAQPGIWNQLDQFLQKVYIHEKGFRLRITSVCIDSGGHHTQEVYRFCKPRYGRRVFAIKGMGGPGKALVGKPSKSNSANCPLFPIGADTGKDLLFSRLKIKEPGPGYCHFPTSYDEEFFLQLTSEKVVTRYLKGRPYRQWVKKASGARNEALDIRVYAIAALELLNAKLNKLADQFDSKAKTQEQEKPQEPASQTQRGRRIINPGWMNSWKR